jgi:hypothetical protein
MISSPTTTPQNSATDPGPMGHACLAVMMVDDDVLDEEATSHLGAEQRWR